MNSLKYGGICLTFLLLANCAQKHEGELTLRQAHIASYSQVFPQYCSLDPESDFQMHSNLAAFFGDHAAVIKYATRDRLSKRGTNPNPKLSYDEIEIAKAQLQLLLNDTLDASEEKIALTKMLSAVVGESKGLEGVFQDFRPRNAIDFIAEQSEGCHFVLINEAHHSSQNRKFTTDLLAPLRERGYKYLALETLSHTDDSLMIRKYPRMNSGYYTKDPVFGNMLREAIRLGYEVIPYEAAPQNLSNSNERDKQQAENIYKSTLEKDPLGKVIVHAGYSHISEASGGGYVPMGYNLGQLAKQSILTVDQESMTEMASDEAMNAYYVHATGKYDFNEPIVFVDQQSNPLVEALNAGGIDIQVYHPKTTLVKGRPHWLLTAGFRSYNLPAEIIKYKGNLLMVLTQNDSHEVPIDAVIIEPDITLVLEPGEYRVAIVDCNGALVAEGSMKAN
jgi:hypothetical protein